MLHSLLQKIHGIGVTIIFLMLGLSALMISSRCIELSKPVQQGCGVFVCGNIDPAYGPSEKGQVLFTANCQRCHIIGKKSTGPNLMGVRSRWADSTNLTVWIKNSQRYIKNTEDPYAIALYKEYGTVMPAFPDLSDEEIREILNYIP